MSSTFIVTVVFSRPIANIREILQRVSTTFYERTGLSLSVQEDNFGFVIRGVALVQLLFLEGVIRGVAAGMVVSIERLDVDVEKSEGIFIGQSRVNPDRETAEALQATARERKLHYTSPL